ncbi:transcription regulator [Bacteroidia bacterium]|nr:transcription regulator [Bacteroidia bacterium]GHV71387.1 transcription regulator [Bacteroidia bacterium]
MSVFYLKEHSVCSNYISDYNIGFKSYSIAQGDYFIPSDRDCNCLFFLINGSVELDYESHTYMLKKDTLCFIPLSSDFKIRAKTDAYFVINYFNKPIDLCEKAALESLASLVGENHQPTLKVKPPLKKFLSSLIFYMDEGVFCKHFHEIKQKELFFILRYFYTKAEIAGLFAPIISDDLNFNNMVLSNYQRANSVKELARICNYSLSSFNRFFKKNFEENPSVWLQNQKLKYITGKLSDKNIPMSQIIDEFKFSSPAHFTTFCKKHLNQTPTQFRKQHKK